MISWPQHDVTFVIADLSAGGAQRVIATLANTLADQGFRVCFVTFAGPEKDFYRLNSTISRLIVGHIGNSASLWQAVSTNIKRIRALRNMLQKSAAPVVVSFIGITNILTVLAGIGQPWRTVISERNDPEKQSLGRLWNFLRRRVYPLADLVTANSQGAIQTLGGFVSSAKLKKVRNPIDLTGFPISSSEVKRDRIIFSVGRLSHQKAYDVLLTAFAQASDQMTGWRLQIAGEGPLESSLRDLCSQLEIADRVDWLGRIEDIAPKYRHCGIFAMPSRFEGLPNALLEALASGCAAIVSDASTGPLEYVTDDATGVVVPSEDVAALTSALVRLAADSSLCRRLGAAARSRVEKDNVASVVDEWRQCLNLTKVGK